MEKLQVVSDVPVSPGSPYDEWGRLTRFLESARLVFAREQELWSSLGIEDESRVRIAASEGNYKVALHRHIDAIGAADILHASVLVHSYALAESAAADRLAAHPRSLGGIEDWGLRLLSTNDRDWTDVKGGLSGAVEVAVARNALAHGSRTIDVAGRARLVAAGAWARPVGSVVTLTYGELKEFRDRLKSLLNVSGIGH